jgi:hypothetical protein
MGLPKCVSGSYTLHLFGSSSSCWHYTRQRPDDHNEQKVTDLKKTKGSRRKPRLGRCVDGFTYGAKRQSVPGTVPRDRPHRGETRRSSRFPFAGAFWGDRELAE